MRLISRLATVIYSTILISKHLTWAQLSNTTTPALNLTAIAASNGSSVLECWQISSFAASAQAGTSGALNLFLSDAANISYTIIPARYNGGVHRAPTAQFVYFTSGLAHITLPNTTEGTNTSVWVQGGKYGLIIAVDTANVSRYGHITTYPSDADTVAVQVPFASGTTPNHIVLHNGPCIWEDLIGL